MADTPVFGFHCTNSDCGKLFKMRYPGKPGYFKVTCPHCGAAVTVKVPAPAVKQSPTGAVAAEDVTDRPPVPDTPGKPEIKQPGKKQPLPETDKKPHEEGKRADAPADNSAHDVIDLEEYPDGATSFAVGEKSVFTCPHCRERKLSYTATKEGMLTFSCPGCKGKTRVMFRNHTVLIDPEHFNGRQGKLVQVRSLWRRVDYALPLGEHIVGRADNEKPSTINIKGDSSMSRQSISISAFFTQRDGYRYLLRVLNATNPVLHCGRALTQGEEGYLAFGEEIRLGGTLFRFLEDEKAQRFPGM